MSTLSLVYPLSSIFSRGLKFKVFSLIDVVGEMSYYAVAKGRNPGIYRTWDECKAEVHKFSGPVYKKFSAKSEAEEFIRKHSGRSAPQKSAPKMSSGLIFQLKRQLSPPSSSDKDFQPVHTKKQRSENCDGTLLSKIKEGFSDSEKGYVDVFTDGACSSNGRGNAKAGIGIWFGDDHPLNVSKPVHGKATNNMAEIQAVTVAARQASKAGIAKLRINTDSQFLISCITKWMPKWKKNQWLTSSGSAVKNKEELIEMEKALAPLKVSWNHVRGHAGIHGNEMADKLAREGSEQYKR